MALATGQITIMDLNDITLQGFLNSNQPKIQFLATNNTTYTPDWSVLANNVVITAEMYQMGDSTNYMLQAAKATGVVWSYKLVGETVFSTITTGVGGFTIAGTNSSQLTIAANKMTAAAVGMTIRCVVQYVAQTGVAAIPYTMDIDYSLSKQGETGAAGASTVVGYLSNENMTLTATTAGAVTATLATTTMSVLVGLSDDSANWTYVTTPVNCTITGTNTRTITLATFPDANNTAYVDIAASRSGYASVTKRFTVSKSKVGVDGTGASVIGLDGPQIFSYNSAGALVGGTSNILAVTRVLVPSYTVTSSINNGTSWTAVTSTAGQIVIAGDVITVFADATVWSSSKVLTLKVTGNGVSDTHTLYKVHDGVPSKTVSIMADSYVLKTDALGVTTPDYITLTAQKQNTTNAVTWSGLVVYNAATAGATTTTGDVVYVRKAEVIAAGGKATITATVTDGSALTDKATISVITEGLQGITVVNSNESTTVPASYAGGVSDYTSTTNLISVYEGATKLTYDGIGTAAGKWTATAVAVPASKITNGALTVSSGSMAIGAFAAMDNATNGIVITYTISGKRTNGTAFTQITSETITKSKAGVDPILMTAWAPTGDVFTNTLGGNPTLTIEGRIYEGSTLKTPTAALWFYQDNTVTTTGSTGYDAKGGLYWHSMATNVAGMYTGGATAIATVYADFIAALQVFKVVLTYNSVNYSDTVIVRDYTDPYQLTLVSSNGLNFLDGVISTVVTCVVRQNGEEVDAGGTLMSYVWTKTDKDGVVDTAWNTAHSASDKTLELSGSDISKKATFTCTVTEL